MLIIESTINGKTVVRIRKDWHPGRISQAYTPPYRPPTPTKDMYTIQTALLRNK
jgi:hypothetical protein